MLQQPIVRAISGPILLVQSLVPTAVCAQPQPELQELQIETEKAQKSIVQWEECLNKQAPNLADQAQDFPWFRRHLKAKCLWAELDLTQSFWPSISGLTPNSKEYFAQQRLIRTAIETIRARFPVGSEEWFTARRGALVVPRFFPGAGGEDCAQRIAAGKLGNHEAVENAFPASSVQHDSLETTQQSQNRIETRAARALAAIDHAQGKPVVYTNLPIYLQYSGSPFFSGQYDANKGVLNVSILDTRGYDPRDRDDVGSNMLRLRTHTIKGASYGAQNGFGASTTVTDYTSIVHHWQVANSGGKYNLTVDLPIAPAVLRQQLPQLRLFILGELREPYVKRRNVRYRLPTLKNPSNEAIDAVIVYAPLRCAAIFNAATGKVLTAGAINVAALP